MNIAEAHSSAADRVGMHSLFGRVPEVSAPGNILLPHVGSVDQRDPGRVHAYGMTEAEAMALMTGWGFQAGEAAG